MSTKTGNDAKTNSADSSTDAEEREGGLIPAILAGAGILAVVGLLVFWPSGDDGASGAKGDKSAQKKGRGGAGGRAGADANGGNAQGGGGVGARAVDDATPGAVAAMGRRNPKVKMPVGLGMAPAAPIDEGPPDFKNKQEEVEWYEAKLDRDTVKLEMRQSAVDRLPRKKQLAEDSGDPAQMARYTASEKIVKKNLEKAKTKIEDVEKKLAELRGE